MLAKHKRVKEGEDESDSAYDKNSVPVPGEELVFFEHFADVIGNKEEKSSDAKDDSSWITGEEKREVELNKN